jgi:hypothetical protein
MREGTEFFEAFQDPAPELSIDPTAAVARCFLRVGRSSVLFADQLSNSRSNVDTLRTKRFDCPAATFVHGSTSSL